MKLKELKEGDVFKYKNQKYMVDIIFYVDKDFVGVTNTTNYQHLILDANTEIEEQKGCK